MGLREELLAETGPKTHVAELCGRAADELIIKEMVIAVRDREIEMLRDLLQEIEIRTATGEGLTPEECMAVHLMANVRDD